MEAPKFKIGDRVRAVDSEPDKWKTGDEFRVTAIQCNPNGDVFLGFNEVEPANEAGWHHWHFVPASVIDRSEWDPHRAALMGDVTRDDVADYPWLNSSNGKPLAFLLWWFATPKVVTWRSEPPEAWTGWGIVTQAGGGVFEVYVDRDTLVYPPLGARVYVEQDLSR